MKTQIVADGEMRLQVSKAYQERLRGLRESIRTRYAVELAEAGFFRRLLIRWRIAAEFRRERQKIEPSPYSLYGSEMAATGPRKD